MYLEQVESTAALQLNTSVENPMPPSNDDPIIRALRYKIETIL